MRKCLFILSFFIFLFAGTGYAQIRASTSNLLRYGNGVQRLGDLKKDLVYRENLTDIKFRFPYDITVGFRLLYDNPPEVGQSFKGISRRFIEYTKEELTLRAGNLTELYGRGLAVNLFENRGLAYDTWMDGVKANYKVDGLKASLLYGTIDFADSINFWRKENYTLTGGNIEYEATDFFSAGLSYVDAAGKIPLPGQTHKFRAEVPEFYFTVDAAGIKWFFDWSQKWTKLNNGETSAGSGIYSSLSFNAAGFGVLIDYKNYRYDQRDPFQRDDFTRPTRMLPFQNPPIVIKEHSYLFLSRSIHEIDFNDEVGLQVELFYSLSEETYLNLNASLSSRHDMYNYNPAGFNFTKENRNGDFLPSTEDEYSPFWEYLFEVEHSFDYFTSVNVGFAQRSKVLYNDFTGLAGTHKIHSTVIPFLLQHTFSRDYSAQVQYEFESVHDNFNTSQPEYANHFISLIGNFFSVLNANVRYEMTTNRHDLSKRKDWFTVEAGYKIGYSHNISISYGRERGGQTCSNGVCRYILPFEGFKLTFLSTF